MLLPASFGSLEDSYHHLKKSVQVWDVAGERQVEINGKDSAKLVQLMTCRDLSKSKDGRCYYCPIIDDKGGIINDPVVLRLSSDRWWLSIADSDVLLFAKGLAIGNNFSVNIFEPDVNIIAVQGPKSFKLMEKIFGEKITQLKFFGFDYYDFKGTKHLIARSGWSKQGGYEIYVEHTKSGLVESLKVTNITIDEAQKQTLDFLSQHTEKGRSPLCGNTISHDRRFLRRYMPELDSFFHYRNVDVSSIKELIKRWNPELLDGFRKSGGHRAMEDVLESIEELKFYRDKFFI